MTSYAFDQTYDSDDQEEHKFSYDGKDIVIFIVDCAKSMFVQTENEQNNEMQSPFELCLNTLDKAFREKIVRGMKDWNAVILYNTEKSPELKDGADSSIVLPPKCAVLVPIQRVEADMIRYVKNLKESDNFETKYGHSSDAKISDVLWLCNSLISNFSSKIHSLTIFWLTNEDLPHDTNSTAYNEAVIKAKDLQHLQMYFELCPLKADFDVTLFYSDIMTKIMNTDIEAIELNYSLDEITLAEKLLIHHQRCRVMSYLTVEISDKAKFGVGVYSELRKSKEPKAIVVDRKSKDIIRTHRSYKYGQLPIDDDADEETEIQYDKKLTAEKAVKFLDIGGRKVKFTPLEVYEMKQVMQPKIKILGFKPFESFNPLNHKQSGYFIHPNDKHIKNSSKMFRALWETCLKLGKIALVAFSMRFKSYPQLAYLIPQLENEFLQTSDGFKLEFIPYSEDRRDVSKFYLKELDVPTEADAAMSKIMSNLTINYNPMIFKNPVTSKIYSKLEEIEFDEESKKFNDTTAQNAALQDDRIGPYVEILSELIDGFAEANPKRKTTAKEGENPSKRVALDIDHSKVLEMCQKKDTKNIKVDILKEYLRAKNVSGLTKLKKDELIAKVLENP